MFLPALNFHPTDPAESNRLKTRLTFQQKARIMRYHPQYQFPRPPTRITLLEVASWLGQSFRF